MSIMFQGSICKNFSDILEHLESSHPTKFWTNTKPSYHCPSNIN